MGKEGAHMTDPTKLAEEFNKRFTSVNGIDVPERVSVPREEWRNLYGAIKAQRQCKWPTCQSEEYQRELAEQLNRELVSGEAKPTPEQYTALQQALTRLQKRYGELEGKLAAQTLVVKYDGLYEYAQENRLSYNELCAAVTAAVAPATVQPVQKPAQQQWVGLTDAEKQWIRITEWTVDELVEWVNTKLKEKNT
jgi:hypothetical protein